MRDSLIHGCIMCGFPSPVEEKATFRSRKRKGGDEKEAVCQVGPRCQPFLQLASGVDLPNQGNRDPSWISSLYWRNNRS